MENNLSDSERMILIILKNLHRKNIELYNSYNESQKTKLVLNELIKMGILFSKKSNELEILDKFSTTLNKMYTNIKCIKESNIYSNNQTKLFRLGFNLNKIFTELSEFENNLNDLKSYIIIIKTIRKNLNKYNKKVTQKQSATKISNSVRNNTRKKSVDTK